MFNQLLAISKDTVLMYIATFISAVMIIGFLFHWVLKGNKTPGEKSFWYYGFIALIIALNLLLGLGIYWLLKIITG